MRRFRALLAVVCAFTWCSAVLHADLETLGWIGDHHHHHHHHDPVQPAETGTDAPWDGDETHEPVVARGQAAQATILPPVFVAHLLRLLPDPVMAVPPPEPAGGGLGRLGRADPALRLDWQFVWRCAPHPAAPPTGD